MQQTNGTAAAAPEPLPSDVEAARKARINKDLLDIFKRPCPENTRASIQGIGLYTHVAAPLPSPLDPRQAHIQRCSNPIFLRAGGPLGVLGGASVVEGQISEDVRRASNDVQIAMVREGQNVGHTNMSYDQLKERYGALGVPEAYLSEQTTPKLQPQPQLEQVVDRLQIVARPDTPTPNSTDGAGHQSNQRRPSAGDGLDPDIIMGGTNEKRRGSTSATTTGNTYEAARDPRRRRL